MRKHLLIFLAFLGIKLFAHGAISDTMSIEIQQLNHYILKNNRHLKKLPDVHFVYVILVDIDASISDSSQWINLNLKKLHLTYEKYRCKPELINAYVIVYSGDSVIGESHPFRNRKTQKKGPCFFTNEQKSKLNSIKSRVLFARNEGNIGQLNNLFYFEDHECRLLKDAWGDYEKWALNEYVIQNWPTLRKDLSRPYIVAG